MAFLHRIPFLALLGFLCCASAWADVVVVVDAKSGVERLTQDEVVNIFLGRYRKLPTGVAAVPIDQPFDSGLRAQFYRKLVNKSLSEINAYWARLYFSGKTAPPLEASLASEVLANIIGNPGGIGYIEQGQADARVRVVFSFPP